MADFVDPLVTARIEAATLQLETQADRAEELLDELEAGSVASVNGMSGVVVLDADDISDTTTVNKFITQAELDKLAGVESGAQVNTFDFADAPSDGSQYARKDGAWAVVVGGGGGSVAWGDITGTLSSQTDLQAALNSKLDSASYTAADVKSKYESNANTNAFTDAEKTKLTGIATGAEVNTVDTVFGRSGAVVAVAGDYDDTEVSSPAGATNYTPTASTVRGHLAGIDTALASAGGGGSFVLTSSTATNANLLNHTNISAKGAGRYVVTGASTFPNLPHPNVRWLVDIYEVVAGEFRIEARALSVALINDYQQADLKEWSRYVTATGDSGWSCNTHGGYIPDDSAEATSLGGAWANFSALKTRLELGLIAPTTIARSTTANVMPDTSSFWIVKTEVLFSNINSGSRQAQVFICTANKLSATAADVAPTYVRLYTSGALGVAATNGTWTLI